MPFDPWRPGQDLPHTEADLKPADEDVIRTLAEIEKASSVAEAANTHTPVGPARPTVQLFKPARATVFLFIAIGFGTSVLFLKLVGKSQSSVGSASGASRAIVARSFVDASSQMEAETLLQKLGSGDSAAADQIFEMAASWTGRTERTAKATQFITTAINLPDLHVRQAALRAELALDGVTVDDAGLASLEQSVGNSDQRAWALWMLGAIANRGVDTVHAAKIIESYLADPAVDTRTAAVNGLALVGTDETIPMMLDRFRNDPSTVVQERAACALAESGMYTHEQRMTAAATLVTWLDDPLVTSQQRLWTLQALRDISGQNLGTDSAAWRTWYEGTK